jgi:hypothetical protein
VGWLLLRKRYAEDEVFRVLGSDNSMGCHFPEAALGALRNWTSFCVPLHVCLWVYYVYCELLTTEILRDLKTIWKRRTRMFSSLPKQRYVRGYEMFGCLV